MVAADLRYRKHDRWKQHVVIVSWVWHSVNNMVESLGNVLLLLAALGLDMSVLERKSNPPSLT